MFLGVLLGCVSSSWFSVYVSKYSRTVSTSSITISCIHNSPKTCLAPTQAFVKLVEGKALPIQPWWISGGELDSFIPNINNVVFASSTLFFDDSNFQDCFQLSNDDPLFIVLAAFLQRAYAHFPPLSRRVSWVNGIISENDSNNFITHYFASYGVSLVLPILEYTLWNIPSYKPPNVLTTDNQNSERLT